jgi:hypothetical protein
MIETMKDGRVFHCIDGTVWLCNATGEVVITGDPRDVKPEGYGHSCDCAGCGQCHVLAWGRVVGMSAGAAERAKRERE